MLQDGTEDALEFSRVLETIRDPSSSSAIPSTELASKLGLQLGSSRDEAILLLDKEILAPVRDLSGPELWRWQV
jgi:antiviral helicase SKI2